jgi:hypothetical protein
MKLDLSGASTTIVQQVEQLKASIKEDILKELLAASKTSSPVNVQEPTPTTTVDQVEANIPAPTTEGNAAAQPQPQQPSPIVRHVAAAKQVQWAGENHLPYNTPVNWQNFGQTSYAAVAARPPARSAMKNRLQKSAATAKAAVSVALAALVPTATASSPKSS